jgi:hypothetical protein
MATTLEGIQEEMDADDDDDMHFMMLASLVLLHDSEKKRKREAAAIAAVDPYSHTREPRAPRKKFKPLDAVYCINRDYLGPSPLFDDTGFVEQFRISRGRFQRLMEDVAKAPFEVSSFFIAPKNPEKEASFEAKLLLPLKTLAYGVPHHTFRDYFSMSKTNSRECCKQFDVAIYSVYKEEYLRKPTKEDLKAIVKLHKNVHKVDGMMGSLDCSHTVWHKCPKAWQGSFKGKEKKPTIVMEAICDYHLWFWNVSYGYAGTLNDLNILNLSPFLDALLDGSFEEIEELSGTVPYHVLEEEFKRLYVLVDGIYPRYSRFVRSFKDPLTKKEKYFSAWQEGARKDIERAFGVLQAKWQFITRPIQLHSLHDIAKRVGTCVILHNMCVSDRVMGDVRARYNPMASVTKETEDLSPTLDQTRVQADTAQGVNNRAVIGVDEAPDYVRALVARVDRFKELANKYEHARLLTALLNLKGNKENY